MTCRLLCALLVLALCCCPSVCGTTSSGHQVIGPDPGSNQNGTGATGGNGQASISPGAIVLQGPDPNPDSPKSRVGEIPRPNTEQEPDEAGGLGPSSGPATPSAKGPAGKLKGIDEKAASQGISGTGPANSEHPSTLATTAQENGENDTEGVQSSNNPSTNQTNMKADDSTETFAVNTTNTTTTTTTTTAPEAPSTTTTEAPTTTTTGAPSRLPEIDGSLSSSAWVCAPLLLAVSALAYTTLG
ncbi:mucin TcMUCII, putative [Trypanosoma cruzi marinkellei]|uniref:Mucin TcMUCII, putative n=1 Tax=Trypanosoma cruzi marinkellei TaxID=85056 RepID=K2MLX1_TRYCR|nr:mucin TcMUCII, putative [Trypanosoma cruzi marinkellei]